MNPLPSFASLFQWALPSRRCLWCDESNEQSLLCNDCRLALPQPTNLCTRCALALAAPSDASICGRGLRQPPLFQQMETAADYLPPVNDWIARFKHRHQLLYGAAMSEYLLQTLKQRHPDSLPDALVPIPLHWTRHLLRGFNQSQLIAQHLSQPLKLAVLPALTRDRRPSQQQQSSLNARRENLTGTFSVRNRYLKAIRHQHIALVDDVVTTGSTVIDATRALRNAGASTVEIWCLARTPKTQVSLAPTR